MTSPYINRYNADFPNNTTFRNGELVVIDKILSDDEIQEINDIAGDTASHLNDESMNFNMLDVALIMKHTYGGEIFNSGGHEYLYAKRINPHVWISVSDDCYLVYYSKEEQVALPWGQLTPFTEYYL